MEFIGRAIGKYRASRRASYAPGRLLVEDDDLAVMLLDISRDGAKISLRFAIEPGSAVVLKVKGESIPALVQWSKPTSAGLRFLDRMNSESLRYLEGQNHPVGPG